MQEERLAALEDEVKVLNNEIKQVLLDIREQVIARFQNPLPDFDIGLLEKEAIQHRAESSPPVAGPGEADSEPPPVLKPWKPEAAQPPGQASGGASLTMPPGFAASTMPPGPISGPVGGGSFVAPDAVMPGFVPQSFPRAATNAFNTDMPAGAIEPEAPATAEPEESSGPATMRSERENMETIADILEPRKNGKNGARANGVGNGHGAGKEDNAGERPDLLTVATLSRWLTSGMKQVGRERMEAVIDIYAAMGGLSPELKEILLRLLRIHDGEGAPLTKTMSVLMELDNLQTRGRIDKTEAAVLSLFLNNGNGRKEVSHR